MPDPKVLSAYAHQRAKSAYSGVPTDPYKRRSSRTEFAAWMASTGTTAAEVARQLGVSKGTVSLWASGRLVPGLVHAYRLEVFTDFKVPMLSWLSTPLGKHMWNALIAQAGEP